MNVGAVPAAVPDTPWQRLPVELASAMRARLPAAVPAITTAVTEATPAFAGIADAKLARDVRAGVQAALERFLDLVGTGEAALPSRVREVFVALGAAEARENRGPEALLAALRTAARVTLRVASEALADVRPVGAEDLIDLADAISAYIDELAAASTDGLARQLREQAGERDRRRRQLAELLLRGGAPPSVVSAAAAGIGWPDLRVVRPVLLPPEQARDARFRFGADGVVAERSRDAVLLLRAGGRAERAGLVDALAGRGAVAGPALGWAEVPEAVRLAEATAELIGEPARRTEGTGQPSSPLGAEPLGAEPLGAVPSGAVPVFADDYLAALALRGEPGALAVLTQRRLAPLAQLRASQRENLLATLDSWLRHWGSRVDVAAELFVHPQTVSYRLNRLRALLGDELDDPTSRFEWQLVLAARRCRSATG